LVCEEEDKINFLWSFLVNHKYKKTLIFVTCCKQARFLTEALRHLRPGLPLNGLWGTQKQNKRLDVFEKFDHNNRGSALIATDIASRGLDFNNVDWVVQLDCPSDVDDYIHRVGRTARMERSGEAVLVLTPSQEEGFLKKLTQRNVPLSRIAVDTTKMADIRNKLSSLMIAFPELKDFAQGSFVAYAKSIHSQKAKDVFDMKSINFDELASSYGLASTPRLRFLKKQGLIANEIHPMEKPNTQQNNDKPKLMELIKETTALNGAGNSDEEEDDFLQITRRNVQDIPEETEAEKMVANKRKALTKAQAARKALKSGVPIANKTVFKADEDQKDTQEVTTGKLVLSEAQKEMKEKSKKDKLEHKEILKRHKKIQKDKKKRKANGHNQEDELDLAQSDDNNELEAEADLSWIPDPDKTYESEDDEVEDSEITQSSKKRKSTTDTFSERKKKRRSVENAEEKALALLGL
jgi:ATP-dependent RNA helicase DDX10/DBP4